MPKFIVLVSECCSLKIEVEAENAEAAKERVSSGDWEDSDIVDRDALESEILDVEETEA